MHSLSPQLTGTHSLNLDQSDVEDQSRVGGGGGGGGGGGDDLLHPPLPIAEVGRDSDILRLSHRHNINEPMVHPCNYTAMPKGTQCRESHSQN